MERSSNGEVLICVLEHRLLAEQAVETLHEEGFSPEQVRAIYCDADVRRQAPAAGAAPPSLDNLAAFILLGGMTALLAAAAIICVPNLSLALFLGLLLTGLMGSAVFVIGLAMYLEGTGTAGISGGSPLPQTLTAHLSRGVVIVRPDGREAEAAAILGRFTGCRPESIPAARMRR